MCISDKNCCILCFVNGITMDEKQKLLWVAMRNAEATKEIVIEAFPGEAYANLRVQALRLFEEIRGIWAEKELAR